MLPMFARRSLAAAFALLSLCLAAGVAEARSEVFGAAPLVRISSGRPAVLVVINERGPFLFVVDTATTNTVLTPGLLARLRPPKLPGPPVDVISAAGSVRSPYYRLAEVGLGGVIVENGRAVVMPLPEETGVVGVLGAEFLSNFKVDLDMPRRRMALYPPNAQIYAPDFVRVQGVLTEHGIIIVPALAEKARVAAAFDSGGRNTIANTWLASVTGNMGGTTARNYESWVRDAASQRYVGVTEDLTRITVGPATWNNRNVLISDIRVFDQIGYGTKPIIFLGMDLMSNRRVIVDYAGASLWLSR